MTILLYVLCGSAILVIGFMIGIKFSIAKLQKTLYWADKTAAETDFIDKFGARYSDGIRSACRNIYRVFMNGHTYTKGDK